MFIVFDGLPVPFYIESFTRRGNTKALVRLTDICSMEDVEEIAGKAVYVSNESLPEMTLEDDGYAALVGWTVLTIGEGCNPDSITEETELYEVGQITDFMDIPNNPCLEIENGAVIIPLHEDFILSVDPENREIIMQIPAGLI